MTEPLRGGCACGRNRYVVLIPNETELTNQAHVILNTSQHSRRLQASPLTAFFKIPVSWFRSTTIAYKPDETHQTIRKTFAVPTREHLRHQFCGYCGTQLLIYNDSSKNEDDFISLTLGSLVDDDIDRLIDMGMFDREENPDASGTHQLVHSGNAWFEEFVQGNTRHQKGGEVSDDGSTVVEWEVREYTGVDQEEGTPSNGKRKLQHVDGSPEAMQQ